MAINPSIGLVGIAKQADRDTPAAEPTYVHGLTGGSPFGASRSIANTEVACGTRAPSDARVDSISITPSIQALCYPDAFGEYLYAALGAVTSKQVSGTGDDSGPMSTCSPWVARCSTSPSGRRLALTDSPVPMAASATPLKSAHPATSTSQ